MIRFLHPMIYLGDLGKRHSDGEIHLHEDIQVAISMVSDEKQGLVSHLPFQICEFNDQTLDNLDIVEKPLERC